MTSKTIICPICKKKNQADINFCKFCRYPINVKKIDELSRQELSICLDSFSQVLSAAKKPLFKDKEIEQVYDQFLSLYWLRPGSALFRFIEAKILLGFKNKYLKYPILDMGCGEGFFTSILFGARFNKKYDGFAAIDFDKKDIYNCGAKLPKDFFAQRPSPIGFGVDIKETAVRKAVHLAVYDQVKKGDVRKLPLQSEKVNAVFSNMIDDIKKKDLPLVFQEARRVLKKDGYFIFTAPAENFRKFLFFFNKAQDFKKHGNQEQYDLFLGLDRGRSEWQPLPLSFWAELSKQTSFEIVEYIEYGNKDLLQIWDTGLRPFFYHLMAFRNGLLKNNLYLPFKNVYLEVIKEYFFQYTQNQITEKGKGAFAIIVAKKTNEKRK